MALPTHFGSIYKELDSAGLDFRVLELQPGKFEDPIRCVLRPVRRADRHPYTALSYTWGPPEPKRVVSINNHDFNVTSNCESALRHLRTEEGSTTIWVDAICINQNDTSERNVQVGQMRDTYSSAAHVTVWLGDEDSETPLAFHLLTQISKLGRYDPARFTSRSVGTDAAWKAVEKIFTREWFRRIWVVQEVSLARSIDIRCGHFAMSWTTFNGASQWYYDDIGYIKRCIMDGDSLFLNAIQVRNAWGERNYGTGGERSLEHLLAMFSHWRATDLRDKVNALLGMSTENAAPELQPDYSKTTTIKQVFTNVVKYFITRDKRLDILGLCDNPPESQELPSWVPDWTPDHRYRHGISENHRPKGDGQVKITAAGDIWVPSGMEMPEAGYGTWEQDPLIREEMNFSASLDMQADSYFPTTNGSMCPLFVCGRGPEIQTEYTMMLKGIEVDTIHSVTKPLYRLKEDLDDPTFFLDWERFAILHMPPNVDCPYGGCLEDKLDAFWRTICTDRIHLGRSNLRAKLICRRLFEQWRARLLRNADPADAYVPDTLETVDVGSNNPALSRAIYNTIGNFDLSSYGSQGVPNINRPNQSTVPPSSDNPIGNSLLQEYESWKQQISQQDPAPSTPTTSPSGLRKEYTLSNFEASLRLWCLYRKLARTTSGRLALVPEHTLPGDKVYVLYGGSVPYIARPLSERCMYKGYFVDEEGQFGDKGATYSVMRPVHQFVGEGYVHGIMDGEAMGYPQIERESRLRPVEMNVRVTEAIDPTLEGVERMTVFDYVPEPLTEDQERVVAAWREALKKREKEVWFDSVSSSMWEN